MREQRREIGGRSARDAQGDEDHEKRKCAERGPVLKGSAQPDAAIVHHRQQRGEREPDSQVRQVNRLSRHAVQLDGIERGKYICGDAAHGHGLPRTDDEVCEHHHPSGIEADRARENFRGVGNFARCVGHGHHQLAVHIADGQQQNAANRESKNAAERAAAHQPVVHDDQPADPDHRSPSQGEVIGDAQLAGELGHSTFAIIICVITTSAAQQPARTGTAFHREGSRPGVK